MTYELCVTSLTMKEAGSYGRGQEVLRFMLTDEQWKSVRKAILATLVSSAGIDELAK